MTPVEQTAGETVADWISGAPYGAKSELARQAGVTPQTVNRWARGEIPTEHHWPIIEQFFGKRRGTIAKIEPGASRQSGAPDARRLAALERRAVEHDRMIREIRQEIRDLARRIKDR